MPLRCRIGWHSWDRSRITTEMLPRTMFQRVVVQKPCRRCTRVHIEGVLTDWTGPVAGSARAERRRMGRRLDANR